jgi:hypothetical protein
MPWREPAALGLKVTVIVQFPPAASVVPQEFVCEKSPLIEMAEIVSGAPPALDNVTA